MHESLRQFHPVIAKWFEEKVGIPTPPQILGWPVITASGDTPGKSALILAPTGSGKTLAAFLGAIDWLARKLIAAEEQHQSLWGVQILYVSPLKSLANDIQKNLLRPLAEIADTAAAMKIRDWPEIHVAVRTGDTPQKERTAIARRPPHILITTPESLNLMLTTAARTILGTTRFVIVDEVHALAGSKRGVFLSLILERLEEERRLLHGHIAPAHIAPGSPGVTPRTTKRRPKPPEAARLKIAPGVFIPIDPLTDLIRIGLSATARPEETIARWLAGNDDTGNPRPIEIIRTGQRKRLDLQVICPFGGSGKSADLSEEPELASSDADPKQPKAKGTGHWPEVTRSILQMIREHHSTLVFGNSRRLIERLAARFQDELLAEDELNKDQAAPNESIENRKSTIGNHPIILPHHGSIAKEVRLETEQALKRGEVDAVLATSSLELGIDIGNLDLVIQIDSPGNVAAGLQRVGRAGHLEKATAKGRFLARGLYELPSFGALLPLMFEGIVEETHIPENCLDVLAQQIVAACVVRPWKRKSLFEIFRRAMPYAGKNPLTEKQFDSVIGMLSKRAERVTSQGLRPRISFDRVNDELIIMPGAAKVLLVNSGVIADTGQFPVYLAGSKKGRVELAEDMAPREAQQRRWGGGGDGINGNGSAEKNAGPGIRLGELDEEFVYETKEGDRIILGSQTWRVVRIDADRVLVEHSDPGSSRMPFWRGESAPRSEMLGDAVAKFHGEMERRLSSETEDNTLGWLLRDHHFDDQAAENAITFYRRQMAKGSLPTDQSIVIEHFTDRTGEPIIAILCPLGSRVNYALRLALEGQFARRRLPAQIVHHDDGLIIRPPVETGQIPENPLAWLRASTLEQEIVDQIEGTALFGLRFRQNAARALMLPRMTLTQRTPLWQQRLRARHLLALVKRQRNFPVIVETYRECLQDVLNIPRITRLLSHIESGQCAVRIVRNQEPSPFARSLFSQFMAAYLYSWDDPLMPVDVQPAVDQHILDEILHRRAPEEGIAPQEAPAWNDADEELLRRRILGSDYPARTAEELLEKIEAAGAAGIAYTLDDPRWAAWAVGGMEDARQMLAELSEKRRLLLVEWGKSKKNRESRWLAIENLGLLLTAREGEAMDLKRLSNGKLVLVDYAEIPAALLANSITPEEARRLLVEQTIKREPVTTAAAVVKELSWMAKSVPALIDELQNEGFVQILAPAVPDSEPRLVWSEYADQLRTFALRRQRRLAPTVDLAVLQQHLSRWQHVEPVSPPSSPSTAPPDRPLPLRDGHAPTDTLDRLEDVLDLFTGLSFPLEFWEYELCPPRVHDFAPALLDGICRTGHRVWVGTSSGASDIAIAFWPRHLLATRPMLPTPAGESPLPLSSNAQRIEQHLESHGASFLFDIEIALSIADTEIALALHELATRGLVSSDQLESLRDISRLAANATRDRSRQAPLPRLHATHPRHVPRPPRMPRQWWKSGTSGAGSPATAGSLGGRWFLLPPVNSAATALDLAERAADRVDRLLRRTAFACRELLEPALDGTWRDAYDVLTRMEWAGSVHRGYYVDGISGSQFALPSVRLTADAASQYVTWLSMLDPANIWSQASTRWISDTGLTARVPRTPGSWVALVDGHPVLAVVSWGQRIIPLPAPEEQQQLALATVATLFPRLPRLTHPFMQVRHWDQQEILNSPAEEPLRKQGFMRDPQGLRLYRQYALT